MTPREARRKLGSRKTRKQERRASINAKIRAAAKRSPGSSRRK